MYFYYCKRIFLKDIYLYLSCFLSCYDRQRVAALLLLKNTYTAPISIRIQLKINTLSIKWTCLLRASSSLWSKSTQRKRVSYVRAPLAHTAQRRAYRQRATEHQEDRAIQYIYITFISISVTEMMMMMVYVRILTCTRTPDE